MSLPAPYYQDDAVTLYCARCEDVLPYLEPGSVDMVFTDPPYPRQYLSCYDVLARQAARLTKPGAFVYAYIGAETMPEVLALMVPHLTWFWCCNLSLAGGWPRVWSKRLIVMSKPVLVFTNGRRDQTGLAWIGSDDTSTPKSKIWHEWEQSIGFARKHVVLRTAPNDVVLDPFAGSGTTLRAAKDTGRRAIGIEMEERHCESAVLRLAQRSMFESARPEARTLALELPA